MSVWYEYKTKVDSRAVDGQGHCRPSALLGFLQEAATLAGEAMGFGRAALMEQHGAFWMLARLWYRLDRPLRWDEELTIHTWHRGGKGVSSYRDFDLYVNGEWVGEAVSLWVLARLEDRKMLRMSQIPGLEEPQCRERSKEKQLGKLCMPKEMTLAEHRLMRYSDTDINGHVNNTRYADFACDAIRADQLDKNTFVASMQLGYHAECHPGETIGLLTSREEGGCFVHGIDETGKSRFDVQIFLGQDIP